MYALKLFFSNRPKTNCVYCSKLNEKMPARLCYAQPSFKIRHVAGKAGDGDTKRGPNFFTLEKKTAFVPFVFFLFFWFLRFELMSSIYIPFQDQKEQDAELTLKAMATQLGINLGIAVAVLIGFSFLRPRHTLVYAPKYKLSPPE